MISQIFMCLSLVAMGLFFFLTGEDDAELDLHKQLGWLPLTALNIFLIAYSAGIGPLALAMMGELLPSHIKGITIMHLFCGNNINISLDKKIISIFYSFRHDIMFCSDGEVDTRIWRDKSL